MLRTTTRPVLSKYEFSKLLDDGGLEEAERQIELEYLRKALTKILLTLPDRELWVLAQRFGLIGEKKTLKQCANMDGVTVARIRQIEQRAMRRLRHPIRARRLREFLDF